ncbi:MAG TPA: DUF1801 domain-containing protein [Thermoanaerobaculia bacterium]|nr:DUF1801 domain-containing protein [Thermoanaerobaculia bacterium]
MAELKTKATGSSVDEFLAAIPDESRRRDCLTVLEMMKKATKAEPKMWGPSIVGFGSYHYKYESGREGDWFAAGFSPRKKDLTLYIMAGFDRYEDLMSRLGKFKTGKSCLYVRNLGDIDLAVLRELITASVGHVLGKK